MNAELIDADQKDQPVRVMVDLETTGRYAGCGILSIGACTFGHHGERKQFYVRIDPDSNLIYGLANDADTMAWWAKQPTQTYQEAWGGKMNLVEALENFAHWLEELAGDGNTVELWGNGADFDNAILTYAYAACDMQQPWNFRNSRCFRTLKALFPEVQPPHSLGTHHVAIDDAIYQADHAEAILDSRDA